MGQPNTKVKAPEGQLTLEFFKQLPKGTEIKLYYNMCNRGSFRWKHDHVVEKAIGNSGYRVYGQFWDDDNEEWTEIDGYLYELYGVVCRGSGAEPVHAHRPKKPDKRHRPGSYES